MKECFSKWNIWNATYFLVLLTALASCQPSPSSSKLNIIGGRKAGPGEFPFVVAVLRNGIPFCSGTVIAPRFILSAAHCFERLLKLEQIPLSELEVFQGTDAHKSASGKVTSIKSIQLHPEFWASALSSNDLALVETNEDLFHSELPRIQPRDNDEWEHLREGASVMIVGFGLTNRTPTPRLSHDSEPVAGVKYKAKASVKGSRGDELFVGDEHSDTCTGDSGGPALTRNIDSTWRLLAVTSRGPSPCGQEREPGVMTLARAGICWIDEIVGSKNPDWQTACALEQTTSGWQPTASQKEELSLKNRIRLSGMNLRDISWLENARVLELDLSWNNISDLRPLLTLTRLESVDIRGNKLALAENPTLEELKRRGVKVLGVRSQAENISQTEFLRISSLGLSAGVDQRATILALREVLTSGNNERRSLDLATRVVLGLSHRNLRSLRPLALLETAEVMLLNGNPLVEDLSPLLTLPKLRYLDVYGTKAASDPASQEILQTLARRGVTIVTTVH